MPPQPKVNWLGVLATSMGISGISLTLGRMLGEATVWTSDAMGWTEIRREGGGEGEKGKQQLR
jgi:hypothetical protein